MSHADTTAAASRRWQRARNVECAPAETFRPTSLVRRCSGDVASDQTPSAWIVLSLRPARAATANARDPIVRSIDVPPRVFVQERDRDPRHSGGALLSRPQRQQSTRCGRSLRELGELVSSVPAGLRSGVSRPVGSRARTDDSSAPEGRALVSGCPQQAAFARRLTHSIRGDIAARYCPKTRPVCLLFPDPPARQLYAFLERKATGPIGGRSRWRASTPRHPAAPACCRVTA